MATITVYEVTKAAVCKPDDQSWDELEGSRVVLDDEELRIKVEIAPRAKSLAQCRQMFGDTLIVKTSGTCPSGVSVLNIVIIAGCSVLDINDYNGNYSGAFHTLSPGEEWERAGPDILLGYAYIAPGDAGGAPTRIVNQWLANRAASGDVNAWMDANAANHAWNACAIVKGQKYVYFENYPFGIAHIKTEVEKENW